MNCPCFGSITCVLDSIPSRLLENLFPCWVIPRACACAVISCNLKIELTLSTEPRPSALTPSSASLQRNSQDQSSMSQCSPPFLPVLSSVPLSSRLVSLALHPKPLALLSPLGAWALPSRLLVGCFPFVSGPV